MWTGVALAPIAVAADVAVPAEETESRRQEAESIRQMEVGIDALEYRRVIETGERVVDSIEGRSHRYDPALIRPLSLLAEALLRAGATGAADQTFERALHLVRVTDGPFSLSQLPLVYRQADARAAMGDRRGANDREEYALDILMREHGRDDPGIVDGLLRLGDWYASNRYNISARIIYKHLTDIAEDNLTLGDAHTIRAWRGYAETYRRKVWPMPRRPGTGGFRTSPPLDLYDWRLLQGADPFKHYHVRRRAHDRGETAFTRVIEHVEASGTPTEVAEAVLDLADWYLLYRRYHEAFTEYRRARRMLESYPEAFEREFGEPMPIYLPLPTRRSTAVGSWRGVIELALTITHRGDVVGRRTVRADGSHLIEHRVRMAARKARYRPAFDGDRPIKARNVPLIFSYNNLQGAVAWNGPGG